MSGSTSGGTGQQRLSHPGRFRRRWLPFWVLQVTEVVIAVVFVDISIHVDNGGLLVAAAIAFFALAITARAPFGIFRICAQPLHLVLAVVAGVVVAVAPVIPALRPDVQGIIVLEFGAIGLIRMATFTAATTSGATSRFGWPGRGGAPVIDATARVARPAPRPSTMRTGDDVAASSSGAAARWAGRTSGAAAASGKKAAARYGPVAEARVKRTIRSAGRMVGQAAAKTSKPDGPTSGAG